MDVSNFIIAEAPWVDSIEVSHAHKRSIKKGKKRRKTKMYALEILCEIEANIKKFLVRHPLGRQWAQHWEGGLEINNIFVFFFSTKTELN